MQRSTSYAYPQGVASYSRYASSHANSSAFSASANPDEDWTKISDLAERRRIQNRIAQRNYRKKLKRRLEDLERRATSSSASPEPVHSQMVTASRESRQTLPQDSTRPSHKRHLSHDVLPKTPDYLHWKKDTSYLDLPNKGVPAVISSPALSNSSYSRSRTCSTYGGSQRQNYMYDSMHGHEHQFQYQQDDSQTLPPALPTISSNAYFGEDDLFTDEEIINPFSLTYASLSGIDGSTNQAYANTNPHVNNTRFLPRSYSSPYG